MGKYSPVELEDLRARLREAEETLAAIRKSEVDSLVVTGPNGEQVFSLKGAEHPYRVFVEQMLEGALILSGDGTVLYCNRRFAQMVHAPLEKVIGSQFKSFALAADRPELEEILRGPCGTKVHLVLRAADGASVSTQLALSRLPNDPLEAICVVVTDLAEQQQKQDLVAALQKLRLAQEQLQLQNDALVRARLDAEAASDAKDNFLAALSHELRTPLTPVVMAAASLEADLSLPDSVRQELAILRRNVELEARLIDDLLDLTRIVQGKIELRSERVDAHAILGDALSLCRNNMSGKRLELVRALGASRFHVIGDPVRIEQILWNLLRNAVKFTPEGGGIMVRSYNQDQSICISVNDTGIGIEAGAINRIFRPFEQADREITRQFGGLGLGLAISKKLAELQGGAIIAQSDGQERGATFTLTLPTAGAPAAGHQADLSKNADERARRLRILLVEDHDDTRTSLARLLGRVHTVRDVSTVQTALSVASSESFDLVISDIGLPDGSGLELMRALRDRYGLKGICLSGFGMEDDIARSAEAGFHHHLTKPIDLDKLETIILSLAQ